VSEPFVKWTGPGVLAFSCEALGDLGVDYADAYEVAANVLASRRGVRDVDFGEIFTPGDGWTRVTVRVRFRDKAGAEALLLPSELDRDAVVTYLATPGLLADALRYLAASDAGACTSCYGRPDGCEDCM
jgi:hypothetical protein